MMKKIMALCFIALLSGCATARMESDVDRPGQDYRSFDLTLPSATACGTACTSDPRCKAWTYVKPGVQGVKARCWLKNGVPQPIAQSCCVSGVK